MRSGARVMRESRCFPALPLVATSVRVLIPSFARERAVVCLRELSLDQRPLLGKVIGCSHSPKSSARCRIHPKQFVVICARVGLCTTTQLVPFHCSVNVRERLKR